MSRSIGTKPSDSITNKSVMALQKIVDDLKRETNARQAEIVALTERVKTLEAEMLSHTHTYASSDHTHD